MVTFLPGFLGFVGGHSFLGVHKRDIPFNLIWLAFDRPSTPEHRPLNICQTQYSSPPQPAQNRAVVTKSSGIAVPNFWILENLTKEEDFRKTPNVLVTTSKYLRFWIVPQRARPRYNTSIRSLRGLEAQKNSRTL